MEQVLKSYLEYICGKDNVAENIPLSTKTTIKIGGPARFFVTVPSKESLVRLVGTLKYVEYPYFIIGMGANILASDAGYNGVVLRLGFNQIIDNQCFIYADAGTSLKKVCNFARDKELSGIEWAAGIPATVGGAVYMNAGAHGGQISDVVAMVDVLINGEIKTLDSKQLRFTYRHSIFHKKPDWIILGAYFYLQKGSGVDIAKKEAEYLTARKQSQPAEPSSGSTFKRPKTPSGQPFFVGKAIDELGLKGTSIGGAKVSEKHAGFIINAGDATAADVLKLIKVIRKKVYDAHKIKLQTEVKILDDNKKNKK